MSDSLANGPPLNGQPVFDFDACAEWMVELSGQPLQRCHEILFAEWGNDEDQKHA
jgi:hypothetical protein